MKDFVITGARLILPDIISEGKDVLVRGGKIAAIGPFVGVEDADLIDAGGAYLSPGLVDIHIHGAMGTMCDLPTPEGLAAMSKGLAALGTTGFLPTVASSPKGETLGALSAIAGGKRDPAGARVLGIHMEGPYLNAARAGAQRPDALRRYEKGELARYLEAARGLLAVMSLAPEVEGGTELIEELVSAGVVAGAVHTDATYEEARRAIERGLVLSCHTFNAMRPIHHREPGIAAAVLLSPGVFCEFIADGFHLALPMIEIGYRLKGPGRMILVSDAVAALGLPEGEYDYFGVRVGVKGGRVVIAGTDVLAGSASPLMAGVRNLAQSGAIPLAHVIRAASLNPATLIGWGDRVGSIAVGKEADLLLLDDRLDILRAWVGGSEISLAKGEG
jgi:N-acetylglucosamine-6-phosphate deacetylase